MEPIRTHLNTWLGTSRKQRGAGMWFLLGMLMAALPKPVWAGDILVAAGSNWKFLDDGSDQGTAWRAMDFADASWGSGAAQLGYGDNDEVTLIGYGSSTTARFITTYFRHEFQVEHPEMFESVTLGLLRDDGAVVYLNGEEWFRSNMPAGAIDYTTKASAAVGGQGEKDFYKFDGPADLLRSGRNVLAVEVHQSSPSSSDVSFDLWMEGTRRSLSVVVNSPLDGAEGAESPEELSVSATDPEGDSLTVVFYGREVPPAGPDFTLVALPDTQYYTGNKNGGTPAMFLTQVDWILTNRAAMNLAFVTQLGDCVESGDNGGDDVEWLRATNALYRLEDPALAFLAEGVPYGVAVGNHDQTTAGDDTGENAFYNQYFGVDHFLGRSYYGGHHGTNNDNHFELFSASGMDFMIVHLEYDLTPDPSVLDWADAVLKAHPDRRAIVVSHYLLEVGEQAAFGPQGQAVYEALSDNPNLFMMLCGHVPGEGRRTDVRDGRAVHTMLSDYQGRANGGDGWLRILEFSPSNNVVRVKTYSPTLDRYETDADSEFTLACDLRRQDVPFVELGRATGVPSGGTATLAWSGISAGTNLEWYVTVTDGSNEVTSPVYGFSTASHQGQGGSTLAAPSALTAEAGANQAIDLRWSDNSTGEEGFMIERSAEGLHFEVVATVEANESFYCDATAKAPGQYVYRVCAYDAEQFSPPSNEAQAEVSGAGLRAARQPMRMVSTPGSGQMELQWPTQIGQVYRVTYKNDLAETGWTDLTEDIPGTGDVAVWAEPISLEIPRRFYSIRLVP